MVQDLSEPPEPRGEGQVVNLTVLSIATRRRKGLNPGQRVAALPADLRALDRGAAAGPLRGVRSPKLM